MAEEYPHEDAHVGALLANHREALGLARQDLGRMIKPRGLQVIHRIELHPCPTYLEVEDHHQALMDAYSVIARERPASVARRQQWWATAADMSLWQGAAALSPQVAWWWGTRDKASERGAYCNLCRATIHRYDSGRGMTRPARLAVMTHRLTHVTALTEYNTPYLKEVAS